MIYTSRMGRDVIRSVIWIFTCNGLFVVCYSALRLEFLVWNRIAFNGLPWPDIGRALLHGVRFDLSAVFTLSAIPFALTLCPLPLRLRPWRQRLVAGLFLALQLPFVVLNMVDVELMNFVGRRATSDTLLLLREVQGKLLSFILTYGILWMLDAMLIAVLLMAFARLARLRNRMDDFFPPRVGTAPGNADRRRTLAGFARAAGFGALAIVLYIVAIRGGVQSKPVTFAHGTVFASYELNNLVMNSSFTFLQSLQTTSIPPLEYFPNSSELVPLLNGRLPGASTPWGLKQRPQNVVILIMESFGQEYMGSVNHGTGFTPFLDSLAARGLFFTNNFANGRRSIEAMPSILTGLPNLMTRPLINSQYANVRINAPGDTLGRSGYRTAFFHGGHNGTFFLDQFAKLAGFQEYFGFDQYPSAQADNDGNWGVYDDPFLQFMLKKLSSYQEPFFVGFFSLTSHHPYPVPEAFKNRFPKGSLEIFESLGYADYALRHFFEEAQKQEWYRDTLFIITADHTHKPYLPAFTNEVGRYRVPLIFFHPDIAWPPVDTSQITQHADIVPSILDFLGVAGGESLDFGRSVFRSGERYATLYTGQDYILLDREWSVRFRMPETWSVFDTAGDPALQSPLEEYPERVKILQLRLLATLQHFQNGLRENKLLIPVPENR